MGRRLGRRLKQGTDLCLMKQGTDLCLMKQGMDTCFNVMKQGTDTCFNVAIVEIGDGLEWFLVLGQRNQPTK